MQEEKKKRTVFVAHDPEGVLGPFAYSGVFPDDFSLELDPGTCTIIRLVHKHLNLKGGSSERFSYLVDRNGKRVNICQELKATSIAELEVKLDLHDLVWD